jgi:hypothetical protein
MLRHLPTALAAYAAAGVTAPQLFDSAAAAVLRREVLDNGSSWALVRLLAAFATAGHTDEQLFAAVSDVLMPRLQRGVLQARALSRFSWALAAAGYHDMDVFKAIGVQLVAQQQQQVSGAVSGSSSSSSNIWNHLQPRDLAAIAWSLGTVELRDAKPFYALAAAAIRQLPGFTVTQVSSLLWGLAAAGVYHEGFVAAAVAALAAPVAEEQQQQQQQQHMVSLQLHSASPQDVATIAWSLAELRSARANVLAACTAHFSAHARHYNAADAADLAWAVQWSGWALQLQQQQQQQARDDGASIVQQLLAAAALDTEQLSPQQLANLLLTAAAAAGDVPSVQRLIVFEQLWLAVVEWGPGAFTAADAAKVMWAHIIATQQQPHQQQQAGRALRQLRTKQQQQQQQQQQGSGRAAAVCKKLLTAGEAWVVFFGSTCAESPRFSRAFVRKPGGSWLVYRLHVAGIGHCFCCWCSVCSHRPVLYNLWS